MKLKKNGEAFATKHPWHTVDWSIPMSVIADQLGVRQSTVATARRKYAPEMVGKPRPKRVRK